MKWPWPHPQLYVSASASCSIWTQLVTAWGPWWVLGYSHTLFCRMSPITTVHICSFWRRQHRSTSFNNSKTAHNTARKYGLVMHSHTITLSGCFIVMVVHSGKQSSSWRRRTHHCSPGIAGIVLWCSTSSVLYPFQSSCMLLSRVGFLPWQKVFLPGQWKKPVKTGSNWQKVQYINWMEILRSTDNATLILDTAPFLLHVTRVTSSAIFLQSTSLHYSEYWLLTTE